MPTFTEPRSPHTSLRFVASAALDALNGSLPTTYVEASLSGLTRTLPGDPVGMFWKDAHIALVDQKLTTFSADDDEWDLIDSDEQTRQRAERRILARAGTTGEIVYNGPGGTASAANIAQACKWLATSLRTASESLQNLYGESHLSDESLVFARMMPRELAYDVTCDYFETWLPAVCWLLEWVRPSERDDAANGVTAQAKLMFACLRWFYCVACGEGPDISRECREHIARMRAGTDPNVCLIWHLGLIASTPAWLAGRFDTARVAGAERQTALDDMLRIHDSAMCLHRESNAAMRRVVPYSKSG